MMEVPGRAIWGPYVALEGLSLYLDAANERSFYYGEWRNLVSTRSMATFSSPGPSYSTSNRGYLVFTQSGASVSVPGMAGPDMTLEALVRFDYNWLPKNPVVSTLEVGATQTRGWAMYLDRFDSEGLPAYSVRFQFGRDGSSWNTYASSKNSLIHFDSFHQVAVTATGLNSSNPDVRIYVDGQAKGVSFSTATTKAPMVPPTGGPISVSLIAAGPTLSHTASTSLAIVRAYDRALSADEVAWGWEGFRSRFPNRDLYMAVGDFDRVGLHVEDGFLGGIAKIGPTGSLTSRTSPGFDNNVFALERDSSGRLLVGGSFTRYNGASASRIARLNPDLSIDPTFDTGVGFDNTVQDILVQPDGSLLVGGFFTNYKGASALGLVRLNPDGSVDPSLVTGGGFLGGGVFGMKLDSSGKTIAFGSFTSYNGLTAGRIARISATGSIDSSFTYSNPGFNSTVRDVQIDSSGNLWCGGDFTTYGGFGTFNRLAVLSPDSTLNPTFSHGTGFNNLVYSICIQSDGKALASGAFTTYKGLGQPRLVRLSADGSVDATFQVGLGFNSNANFTLSGAQRMVQLADGKILAGGYFNTYDGASAPRLVRLNTDGTRDSALNAPYLNGGVFDIRVVGSEYWVVGYFSAEVLNPIVQGRVVRFDEFGDVDTAFSVGAGFSFYPTELKRVNDRYMLVGSFTSFNGWPAAGAPNLAMLTATGATAPDFNPGAGFGGISPFPNTLCMDLTHDGQILIGGQFTTYDGKPCPTLIRINQQGVKTTPDIVSFPGYGANNTMVRCKVDADGKVLVRGLFTAYGTYSVIRVARLMPDTLSVDTTFNSGSGVTFGVSQTGNLDFDRLGRYVLTGDILTYNGVSVPRICRVLNDGTLDTTFNVGTGFNSFTRGVLVQDDGKYIIWGSFTTYQDSPARFIIRLNEDGSRDSSFDIGDGFSNTILQACLDRQGRILVTGISTFYDGHPISNICRINQDGTLDRTFRLGLNSVGLAPFAV